MFIEPRIYLGSSLADELKGFRRSLVLKDKTSSVFRYVSQMHNSVAAR